MSLRVGSKDNHLSEYFDSLRYLKLEMEKTLLLTLISLCPGLEEVHLTSYNYNDRVPMMDVCKKLKHLEKLTLNSFYIDDSFANYIVEHCHTLKQLSIPERQLSDGAKNKLKALKHVRCQFT